MKSKTLLCALLFVSLTSCLLFALSAAAGEMKHELKLDPRTLLSMFSTYGFRSPSAVYAEKDGLHLAIPTGGYRAPQTGAYSTFSLAGDCEVSFAYELINLEPPKEGYGASVGLAFDAGDDTTRAVIQRMHKKHEGHGTSCTVTGDVGGEVREEGQYIPTTVKRGRLGLRRIDKDVIFLSADNPAGPLLEIYRRPFTADTIHAVRFFIDAGGSPTTIDARLRNIEMKADEIAAGKPQIQVAAPSHWWLWIFPPVIGGLLYWLWQSRRPEFMGSDRGAPDGH